MTSVLLLTLCESRWQSINAKVFCLLASVEVTIVCLEIPLQSPPPWGEGDCHLVSVPPPFKGEIVAGYGGRFQGGGTGKIWCRPTIVGGGSAQGQQNIGMGSEAVYRCAVGHMPQCTQPCGLLSGRRIEYPKGGGGGSEATKEFVRLTSGSNFRILDQHVGAFEPGGIAT